MEDYIWLLNRKEYKELTGSILGSLLFHALMFAILASTSIFHPTIGDSDKLDILWFYPSPPSGWRTEPAEKVALVPANKPETVPLRDQKTATPPPEKVALPKAAPVKATNPEQRAERNPPPLKPQANVAAVKPIVTVPPEEVQEPETEPEMKIPAATEPLPEVKTVEPKVETPLIKKATAPETKPAVVPEPETKTGEPKKSTTPIKKEAAANVVEAKATPAVKETVRPAFEKAETAPPTVNRQQPAKSAVPHRETTATARDQQSGELKDSTSSSRPVTPPVAESAKGGETKTASAAALPTSQSSGVPAEAKGETVRKAAGPAPLAKPAPAAKAESEQRPKAVEGKGIFLPPVNGDLKLEIVGKDDFLQKIKVVVLFHELPKTRRNRPMSKAEYRRFQTISPKMVRTGDTARQAVIEVAGEGIYEFRVETGPDQPVEALFAVKLYDNSRKARTRPVGKRRIAGRESIVKVLMPEGFLWNDDSAFSGSIEDSDSTTKFNTDTGLVWKEYQ